MQCEMLDLVGGSGEKPWSPKDAFEVAYGDIEYTAEELEAFAEMPAGSFADHYFSLIDLVPSGRCEKAVQLRRIMRKRGLTQECLSEAWDALRKVR